MVQDIEYIPAETQRFPFGNLEGLRDIRIESPWSNTSQNVLSEIALSSRLGINENILTGMTRAVDVRNRARRSIMRMLENDIFRGSFTNRIGRSETGRAVWRF
jgi:hypothetical protein